MSVPPEAFNEFWGALRAGDSLEDALETAARPIIAAERDRIRQLALHQASAPLSAQSPIASQAMAEFADLLKDTSS